jgi:hypothetical protein
MDEVLNCKRAILEAEVMFKEHSFISQILKNKKIKYFILENVKGYIL